MGEYALILVQKRFIQGDGHFDGTVALFDGKQESILDEAASLESLTGLDGNCNYNVVAIVVGGYDRPDPNPWVDVPTHEVCRWDNI